jgi:hypothetical protein
MLNYGYLIYQAERAKTQPEQHETDAQLGQLSAAFARLLRPITKPARLAPPARYGPAGSATVPGVRTLPRSRPLTVRTLSPDLPASSSCDSPASSLRCRSHVRHNP